MLYYYKTEYGDWRLLSSGKPSEREVDEILLLRLVAERSRDISGKKPTRISAPPRQPSMPGWYLTTDPAYGVRWRLEPARQLSLTREGVHFALGFLAGGLPFWPAIFLLLYALAEEATWASLLALAAGLTGIGVSAILTHLFLRYEETEGQSIFDWAYRDIGGYLAATLISLGVGVGAAHLILN